MATNPADAPARDAITVAVSATPPPKFRADMIPYGIAGAVIIRDTDAVTKAQNPNWRHLGAARHMAFMRNPAFLITALSILSACATGAPPQRTAGIGAETEVRSTELAFAKAMADRDFEAFVSHLSVDAVFLDGSNIQHGAAEVSAAWKPLFRDPTAPFSWAPDHVEVLASSDLALSTGPVIVKDKVVGRFNSIWRLEAPHSWRIVFDKGESVCADAAK